MVEVSKTAERCPFCGSNNVKLYSQGVNPTGYKYECENDDCPISQFADTPEEARSLWNTRAALCDDADVSRLGVIASTAIGKLTRMDYEGYIMDEIYTAVVKAIDSALAKERGEQ